MTVAVSRQTSAETSKADHQALYVRQASSRSNGKPGLPTQGVAPSRQVSEVASVQGSSPAKKSGMSRQVSWSDSVHTGDLSRQFSRQASGENSRGISKADHQALHLRQHSARSGHQGPLSRQISLTHQSQKNDGAHPVELSRQVPGKSPTCRGATPAISRQASGVTPAISRQASGAAPAISKQTSAARSEAALPFSRTLQQLPENEPVFKNVLTGGKLKLRIIRASNLRNEDTGVLGDVSDPFAVAKFCGQEFKTATINNNLSPQWNSDSFEFDIKNKDAKLHLEVFNSNWVSKHDSLGTTELSLNNLMPGATQTLVKVLGEGNKKSADRESSIEVQLELIPCAPVKVQADPPVTPGVKKTLTGCKLRLWVIGASNLRNMDTGVLGDVSDPFAVAKLGSLEFKTATINNDLNPVWNSDSFEFSIPTEDAKLHLEVFNSNWVSSHDTLGTAEIDLDDFELGATQTLTKVLDEGAKKQADKEASIEIELEVIPCSTVTTVAATAKVKKSRFLKTEDWVPLPNFHEPGAYDRPAWNENNGYMHGRLRPVPEYFSYACRLGQYDYQETPTYYPRQEEVCKETWADDPFHRWRRTVSTVSERF